MRQYAKQSTLPRARAAVSYIPLTARPRFTFIGIDGSETYYQDHDHPPSTGRETPASFRRAHGVLRCVRTGSRRLGFALGHSGKHTTALSL